MAFSRKKIITNSLCNYIDNAYTEEEFPTLNLYDVFIDDLDIIEFIEYLTSFEPITMEENYHIRGYDEFENVSDLIDWIEKNTSSDVNK